MCLTRYTPPISSSPYNLTAKAITEGGFESLFRQTFGPDPNEKLKKTFACCPSTATGAVAGTLYLSTFWMAFCSDRPLYFTTTPGQTYWSYYKVVIPPGDGHDFWFVGLVLCF